MKDVDDPIFEEHRSLLEGIAYRMCGVLADAQDLVQETWLRWRRMDPSAIREPRAWLVTVCSRLAIDLRKSARKRRETYVGTWLPEPFLDERMADPSGQLCVDDTVSVALMLALEKLSPAERAAFLLHEVFDYPFEEIARILGKSEAACRKLASRARTAMRGERPRFEVTPEEHRRLIDAFFQAAREGEVKNLERLLAGTVEVYADGGGKVTAAPAGLCGAEAVARYFVDLWKGFVPSGEGDRIVTTWFNGQPGVLIYRETELAAAVSFAIAGGVIRRIYALRNPDKLRPFLGPPPP